MASIKYDNIKPEFTRVEAVDRLAESQGRWKAPQTPDQITILKYDPTTSILGTQPQHYLLLSTSNPFFSGSCIFLPTHEEIYITSSLLQPTSTSIYPTILISRLKINRSPSSSPQIFSMEWAKMRSPTGIDMPSGGINYKTGILFCAQGTNIPGTGGIYYMPRGGNAAPEPVVTNFHGRDFSSVRDVVVAGDGAVWFTDWWFGYEQDFRPKPGLPNWVYRFDTETGEVRVVVDGLGAPGSICFAPGEKTVYITDLDSAPGRTHQDLERSAIIYAFDITDISGAPFVINKRVFAFPAVGTVHSIKCDVHGNVYAGCRDGVEIWNPAGTMIGRILVPGGVMNFCFGREGEMFLCSGQKLWRIQLDVGTKGALLGI